MEYKNAQDDVRISVEKYLIKTFPGVKSFYFSEKILQYYKEDEIEIYGFKSIPVQVVNLGKVIYYKY